LVSDKTNQWHFRKILFHLIEVAVNIDFAHEKNLFLTGFAQRKFVLWKSCGLDLLLTV
jgi:hypothetical protein